MPTDRHGRALRTPPDARRHPDQGFRLTSSRRFARLVQDVLATLPDPVAGALDGALVRLRDVPAAAAPAGAEVPLAEVRPRAGRPPVVVLYRRPLELRALSARDLAELMRVAVVHEAAEALGLELGEEWDDLDG